MSEPTRAPAIRVILQDGAAATPPLRFTGPFRIGRDAACEVRLEASVVSRTHAEVVIEGREWWLHDRESTNGTWVEGRRVRSHRVGGTTRVRLGRDGPVLRLAVEGASPSAAARDQARAARGAPDVERYIARYLSSGDPGEPVGEHTGLLRAAFSTVRRRQRRRLALALGAGILVVAAVGSYALFQRAQLRRNEALADALFTEMKTLELEIAKLRTLVAEAADARQAAQLTQLEESRRRAAATYDGYVESLGFYRRLDPEERGIHRLARVFNESELAIPQGFVNDVQLTIRSYWQTPEGRDRLTRAIRRAELRGYTAPIVETLVRHGLPPQFFYLALQESGFDPRAVGPPTRWGRAKGMWQFLAPTALRFGLRPGRQPDDELIDPLDERFDWRRSTDAAARYLRDIWHTLAQASGLLVMASYNWGEHRVVDKLEQLPEPPAIPTDALAGIPETPGARNYWRFLRQYRDRIPDETQDYVLKIFSAAVIGEDPRQYGFDFDNPLAKHAAGTPVARSVR
jgi:pSer/pThr/pTyr-binding forkhead associated (FHA) protein